jgi:uncharacterized protein (DUF1810 family)
VTYNLQRFVDAQDRVYDQILAELRSGRKVSHWMWFVFPQLKGLGHSATANHYGIASRDEAEAYLKHPILGLRLRECTQLVNLIEDHSIEEIFGYPDDLKFRSSMTLFANIAPEERIFQIALDKYWAGQPDPRTLQLL